MKDIRNPAAIGDLAEHGGADPAEPKGETEKETGHRSHFAGNEFLRVNQNGGEGGSENESNDRAQEGAPEEIRVWKRECEGGYAQD